ncbi:preprotein translocase subunit SecG [Enterovibrio norvegicus]|uniref:Protein-export membrane protein SecG n=1 Tax=Enterovibrio norvegicus TaxID=188144 RepID=A0ABV4L3V3_9GAMM|nr:preprotein translocase subunit SecG [Enterovibrio norvegicus]OEF54852.1 preprotein translocase subunit SecG [Enterovibrio norvegicus]
MYEILLVIYLLAALGVIGLVLVQQGKGADMGASFGAGASNTVFGSGGSGNFLTRMTAIFATIFFVLSLVLGNMSTQNATVGSEYEDLSVSASEQVTPASDVPAENNSDIPQ